MNQILIEQGYLELVILQIVVDLVTVCFLLTQFMDRVNVEILSELDNSRIKVFELLGRFFRFSLDDLTQVSFHFLFEQV